MKKKLFIIISLLLIVILAGCDQIPQIVQLRDSYLATRTAQLLTQMPTNETVDVMPVSTQITVEETVEVATEIPTEEQVAKDVEPTQSETPEATVEPTFTPIPTMVATSTVPAPTITPLPTLASTDPAVYLGEPAWKDEFEENKGWAVDTDAYSSASIANGAMTLIAKTSYDAWRLAPTDSLGNSYVEGIFTPSTCASADHFGLMFRVPVLAEANQGYLFGITCDGKYTIRKYDGKVGANGQMISLLSATYDANIKAGANQTNRIGIMTIGNRLIFFINGVMVGEVQDATYPQGYVGVFIGSRTTKDFAVKVDNLAYWSNPTTP